MNRWDDPVAVEQAQTTDAEPDINAPMLTNPTPLAVETARLRKVYGAFVALAGLTIEVRQGEVFGFLGPNGAGKTTTVKLLMGLAHPTSGMARLLGRPLGDREAKRKIGFLPELFRFHDWLNCAEFLDLHGQLYRMPPAERRRRIPEVLELVGLAGREHDKLRQYSKGMQQRAGLAQALLNDPQIVFLDEPTSALDPIGRHEVREIIRRLRADGKTVFLNSHLLSEVETVCDRVAIVNHGQLAAVGPVSELLKHELLVELRLGAWNDAIAATLTQSGKLERLEPLPEDRTLAVIQVADETVVARIVDALVAAGVPVFGATPHRPSLEDVFLQIVGESNEAHRA
jgi:ABC-2 type transport system ATP-binding protein